MTGDRRTSILIVDDDPHVLAVFRRLTRRLPGTFRFAMSVEEAQAAVDVELPDVIICDYRLPGVDGLTFLERVRERWPDVRCVLHTGEALFRTHFPLDVPILAKPCPPEELESFLRSLLPTES